MKSGRSAEIPQKGSRPEEDDKLISERAKTLLSEAGVRDGEPAIIFLEEGEEVFAFRMFRANDHTGDPEKQAIRWLGQAKGICRSDHGELRTGMFRSKDEKNVLAAVSGREIEVREWPPMESADSNQITPTQVAAR